MILETWKTYARCWSATEVDRASLLPEQVSPDVRYRDPNVEVKGIEALATSMAGFQKTMPGHGFQIQTVEAHHGRSLARWSLVNATGQRIADGVSYAVHDTNGRLSEIAGFPGGTA